MTNNRLPAALDALIARVAIGTMPGIAIPLVASANGVSREDLEQAYDEHMYVNSQRLGSQFSYMYD